MDMSAGTRYELTVPILLTFDTNIIWDALVPTRPNHLEASELLDLDNRGLCEIRIVTRFDADVPPGDIRSRFEALDIAKRPRIGTIAQWEISEWDRDYWATDEEISNFESLFCLIFPDVQPNSKKHPTRVNDIGHLLGHIRDGRDIFVTRDGPILKRNQVLLARHKLKVMTAVEALAVCKSQRMAIGASAS
jgi:hypothetical protein